MKSLITLLLLTSGSAYASDCMLPFQRMVNNVGTHFTASDVYNDFANVKDLYRYRYIVLNLDSVEGGMCKGLNEHYPSNGEMPINVFPELANPNDAQTYMQSVLKWYSRPVQKGNVVRGSCIGQTVTLCELRGNRAVEIAKLGTSSRSGDWGVPPAGYYGALNVINTRRWAVNRDSYSALDAARDMEMGGVSSYSMSDNETRSYNGWVMPNFMNFVAAPGYVTNPDNGLHEISQGESLASNLGAPVSHGCLRLTKYGAILMRWWMPRGARMFIHFTDEGYRKYANPDGTPRY